jgi:O-antigen/teichoic acid export membrane protein
MFEPTLFFFGLAIVISSMLRLISAAWFSWGLIGKALILCPRNIRKSVARNLSGFSALNFINSTAASVTYQSPVLIIGKILGQESVTAFAPILLVSQGLVGFLQQTARPLVPLASRDKTNNGGKGLADLSTTSGILMSFLSFLFLIPLGVAGNTLIGLWLGSEFVWISTSVFIMAFGVVIAQIQSTNFCLALGSGSILPSVISQVIISIIVIICLIIGTSFLGWGVFEVSLCISLCLAARSVGYLAFAFCSQFSCNYNRYMTLVYIKPTIIAIFCIYFGVSIIKYGTFSNIVLTVFSCLSTIILYVFIFWKVALRGEDRDKIIGLKIKFI